MLIPITSLSAPELDLYARCREVQLLRCHEPQPGLFIAESPKVIERALCAGYEPLSFLVEANAAVRDAETVALLSRYAALPAYTADASCLTALTGFSLTRGLLAVFRRKALPDAEAICRTARRIAVLESVTNPTNVGAIFRSAAALSVDAVLLTGSCSDPFYRRAARVSMGTVFQIPWTYFPKHPAPRIMDGSTGDRISPEAGRSESSESASQPPVSTRPPAGLIDVGLLRRLGFRTAALALRRDAFPLQTPALKEAEKLALCLGAEGDGLSPETISACDHTVYIPMAHGVDSLNVAAASAVAFWELCKPAGGR